ncbi:MAG: hypothetical protein M1497_10600 [Nitrospirae bacterium]|nr:hypothetical protein [Nitrospirota bacterium]
MVSVDNLGEDRESLAPALSRALGITVYDALARLRVPGKGPLIITAYAREGIAQDRAGKLAEAGFLALVLGQEEVETEGSRTIVRTFSFGDTGLEIGSRAGENMRVEYSRVDTIISGARIATHGEAETVKGRKFAPGRAVLSGGLIFTKSAKTTLQRTTEQREGFIHLYTEGRRPFVLSESGLLYDSLGALLLPTRAANFGSVLAELRRRCPGARYDDRLLSKAGQVRLLGPMFDPERYLDLAISLLVRSLRSYNAKDRGTGRQGLHT